MRSRAVVYVGVCGGGDVASQMTGLVCGIRFAVKEGGWRWHVGKRLRADSEWLGVTARRGANTRHY